MGADSQENVSARVSIGTDRVRRKVSVGGQVEGTILLTVSAMRTIHFTGGGMPAWCLASAWKLLRHFPLESLGILLASQLLHARALHCTISSSSILELAVMKIAA